MESLEPEPSRGPHGGLPLLLGRGGRRDGASGRPKKLRHAEWFDPEGEPFENERDAYRPLVWQSRYSGIEVPDDLWSHALTGAGVPYSDNQAEDMIREDGFMAEFDA